MQHIKSVMAKIDVILEENTPSKKTKDMAQGNDKTLRVIANFVKGIREAREEMLNARK